MKQNGNSTNSPWFRALSLIAVFAILMSLAIAKEGRLFGHTFTHQKSPIAEMTQPDGSIILNTTEIGKDIAGYAGPVPLEIFISPEGRIDSVRALPNSETPGFFKRVEKAGLLDSWNGKTLEEARSVKVDAVSGATFSSKGIIGNMEAGLNFMDANSSDTPSDNEPFSIPLLAALIVICAGALIPLWVHSKTYRVIQQVLNVAVLGFWTGTFIDYAMMLKTFSSSLTFNLAGIVAAALLIVGFIFPLFGKHKHYCSWVCPLGSAQELMGHLSKKKISMSQPLLKGLKLFSQILWAVLLLLLWAGIGVEWIDYELFTAFIVKSASVVMLSLGGAFLILSIFIPRPFCRFVCPTGTLLKRSENISD